MDNLTVCTCRGGNRLFRHDLIWGWRGQCQAAASNGSVSAEVEQSTYCWETGNQATCAEYGLPEADNLQLITVKPGDRIDVVYHAEPMTSSFNRIEDGELISSEAIVPDEPGVYLYEIGGEWKQGDSRYVFGVQVPEN